MKLKFCPSKEAALSVFDQKIMDEVLRIEAAKKDIEQLKAAVIRQPHEESLIGTIQYGIKAGNERIQELHHQRSLLNTIPNDGLIHVEVELD